MKQHLLSQFNFHHRLYNDVLVGFTDKETNQRLYGDTRMNHVKYVAGHLLNSQYAFGLLASIPVDWKWNELFAGRGQTKARDDISYPPIQEIMDEWNEISEPLRSGLETLSDDELKCTAPDPLGKAFEDNEFFGNTIGGVWTFLNHHQAYHIGQIGILRMGFGKEPMRFGKSVNEVQQE